MKVRLLHQRNIDIIGAEVVDAKRFKDFTIDELREETGNAKLWTDDCIFAKREKTNAYGENYLFMFDHEVEVIE